MATDFYRFSVSGALKENGLTDAHIPQHRPAGSLSSRISPDVSF
jgi:hypothetical protein